MNSNIKRSSIVGPSGHTMVMLGGDVYDQRVTGDIISEFKWVNGEPVMLIYKNTLGRNSKAFMIELSDAYLYATSTGRPTQRLLNSLCLEAAKALDSQYDKSTIFRLIDVIVDGLADLLKMPPEPKAHEIANRPSSGNDEMAIKIDGKTVIEMVV